MRIFLANALSAAAIMLPIGSATAVQTATPYGIWRNPRGTIEVKIAPCAGDLCGVIARASPEAIKDASDAGIPDLIGLQLLKNYTQTSANRWDGTVYVPDMGKHFSSHIVQMSAGKLRISGCLIGGWLCKSQLWTRP